MSFKSVHRRLNESLRQWFLQEEATILQNQKPPRHPIASGSAKLVHFCPPRVTDSRPLQVIVPDPLESVVAVEVVPADVVRRVGGADPQKRHGAQLGLNATDSLQIFVKTESRLHEQHFSGCLKKYKRTESLTTCSRLVSGESCNHRQQHSQNKTDDNACWKH